MFKIPFKLILIPFSLILTPLSIILIVLPVVLLRLISILTAKLLLPKNTRILAPISSVFTSDNLDKPRCTLVLLVIVDGALDLKTVLNRINQIFDSGRYPEMRQKLKRWLGFWFWEDCSDFNLNSHLHFTHDWDQYVDDTKIVKLRKELIKKPFDKSKPLWEAFVYPYKSGDGDKKSAIFFRIHHCVADGYSLLNGFRDLNEADLKTSQPNFLQRSFSQKVIFWLRFLIITPVDLFLSSWNARDRNAFKIKKFSRESFGYEVDTVDLDTLKRIAKKFRVSVSAVIFAGFTAAIRDAFLKKKWTVPQKFHVPCALPLDNKIGRRKHLTNVMSVLPFPTPVSEGNPLVRLEKIEKVFKRKKNSELALGYNLVFQFCGLIASITQRENGSSFGSAFWTNFPGPKNQQFMFGKKIDRFRFSTDFHNDNVAFGFASICFNGKLLVGCKADTNLFSEGFYTKEFIERVTEEYIFLDKYSFTDSEFV